MFTLSSNFASEFQGLTFFFFNWFPLILFFCCSWFLFSTVFVAPTQKGHTSFSLLDYSPVPIIKESSPHSKRPIFIPLCVAGTGVPYPPFRLACGSLLSLAKRRRQRETACKTGGEMGPALPVRFLVALLNFRFLSVSLSAILHPGRWIHVEVFPTLAGPTLLSRILRDSSSSGQCSFLQGLSVSFGESLFCFNLSL